MGAHHIGEVRALDSSISEKSDLHAYDKRRWDLLSTRPRPCSPSATGVRGPSGPRGSASTAGSPPTSSGAGCGVAHPVEDFLFTYYSYRPASLRRWHPGLGVELDRRASRAFERRRGLRSLHAGRRDARPGADVRRTGRIRSRWIRRPARAPPPRAPPDARHASACTNGPWSTARPADEVRHAAYPLRLGAAGNRRGGGDAPHHAAATSTRFASSPSRARPLNVLQPTRESPARPRATRLPARRRWTSTSGPTSCARSRHRSWWPTASRWPARFRVVDMRAAPYDLQLSLGVEPIRIETPEGKGAYVTAQRSFATAST